MEKLPDLKKFTWDKMPVYLGFFILFLAVALSGAAGFNRFFYRPAPEVFPQEPASYPVDVNRADVNQDWTVNLSDIIMVLGRWGAVGCSCREDVNQDGKVNLIDLKLILDFWDQSVCVPEGGVIPVIPNAPACCSGLSTIGCDKPDFLGECPPGCVGAMICAKCGDGQCGLVENYCNCPQDCQLSSQNPTNEEKEACLRQSPVGVNPEDKWHQFSNGCADYCGAGPVCTLELKTSCDCGPDMCWDRTNLTCLPN